MSASGTSVFWCRAAWLGGEEVADGVVVTSHDGVISSVERGAAPPGSTRLDGLVLPGFANVHSHAFHRALRGRTERSLGSFWTWREAMYEVADRLDPDTLRDVATAAFAEMVCAGFTAVGEFHYLHHARGGASYADPNETSVALLDAAHAAGIRVTLLDACYLESSPGQPAHGPQRRFSDGSAHQWAERVAELAVPTDRAKLGAAIHSVRAVPPDAVEVVASFAETHSMPLHAHVSEQPRENEQCAAAYGSTPTLVLERAGALTERFTAVHATHLSNEDRWHLGDASSAVCVCPTTERALADGICELASLLSAGVTATVGTDSHSMVDPFEELRCLEGHERLRTLERGTLTPGSLLHSATALGHHSLGWHDAGHLAAGAPCDLVCVATESVRLAGTDQADLLAAVVAAASAADVATVVVSGEVVVDAGRHVRLDVPALLERSILALWP